MTKLNLTIPDGQLESAKITAKSDGEVSLALNSDFTVTDTGSFKTKSTAMSIIFETRKGAVYTIWV